MTISQNRKGSGWRSGGPTGLQNQLAELNPRLVGSIPTRSRHFIICFCLYMTIIPASLSGQSLRSGVVSETIMSGQSLDSQPDRVSATGAFIRSLIVPGWGQSAAGSPGRGAFYFGVEGASIWMVLKTARNLSSARRQLKTLEDGARVELAMSQGLQGSALDQAVKEYKGVSEASTLVENRSQQREDWMAVSIFFLLFGAADAFVTAHLQDFPEALEASLEVSPESGVGLGLSLPVNLFR